MRVTNLISFVCIMAAIGIGVMMAELIIKIDTIEPGWCNGRADCLREWISALSGWIAGAGAVVAALVALPYFKRQADEAKRQTDFIVGDADPEFIVTRNRLASCAHLTIRNWNRRHVIVDSINAVGISGLTIAGYKESGKMQAIQGGVRFLVKGWVDRGGPPPERRLEVYVTRGGRLLRDNDLFQAPIYLSISFRQIGQTHVRRATEASSLELVD